MQTLIKLKNSLSLRLLAILLGSLLFGQWMPLWLKSLCYATSLSLKTLLLFVLPAIIFSCLFSCFLSLQGSKALKFMLGLFVIVCASNFISTLIAYGIGSLKLVDLNILEQSNATVSALEPLWQFELPTLLSNTQALSLGVILGAFFSFVPNPRAHLFAQKARHFVTLFLERSFIPVLPLFVLGFVLKMQHDGMLAQIIGSYVQLLLLITLTFFLYLGFLFLIAAKFNLTRFKDYLKNVFPVALMGFSTMSSLATMPVTLKAAEKNTQDFHIPQAVIPSTVNIHQVGVAIAIPMMAMCILSTFGYGMPSLAVYCKFAFYFIFAQFAVAGVPGGAILVMLPLLESHFGFSAEMCGLITALYILFDPAVTLTNVLGNSALVIIVSRLFKTFSKEPQPSLQKALEEGT